MFPEVLTRNPGDVEATIYNKAKSEVSLTLCINHYLITLLFNIVNITIQYFNTVFIVISKIYIIITNIRDIISTSNMNKNII